jgi:cell shape-determining protein MreD
MRWIPFLLLAWVFVGLEIGLRSAMPFGEEGVAPSFALILAVYVAMGATHAHALWAAVLLGACVDLASRRVLGEPGGVGAGDLTILGPSVLGFALSAQFTLTMRGVVFRKNPIALAFLAALSSLVCAVVVVALLSVRSLYDPVDFRPGLALWQGVLSAGYTGVVALPLGMVLLMLNPILGFYAGPTRRGIGR